MNIDYSSEENYDYNKVEHNDDNNNYNNCDYSDDNDDNIVGLHWCKVCINENNSNNNDDDNNNDY